MNAVPAELRDQFKFIRSLGGHQAEVSLVREHTSGQERVLKVYRPRRDTLWERPLGEVLRAWQSMTALGEPHLVRLFRYDELFDAADGHSGSRHRVWELQEHMSLGTLGSMLASGPLHGPQLEALVRQLAAILTALGRDPSSRIVHKDIKPENIFVRRHDPLVLAAGDLGVARVLAGTHEPGTHAGGTHRYMAPESLDLKPVLRPAVDWWSVGVVVAEAILGRHPAPAAHSDLALLTYHRENPVELDEVSDPRLQLLCRGLLHRDPIKRWGQAQVDVWLDGGSPEVPPDVHAAASAGAARTFFTPGFLFLGERFEHPAELVGAMHRQWREANADYLDAGAEYAGRLVAWISEVVRDAIAQDALLSARTPDQKLAMLGARFDPGRPQFHPDGARSGSLAIESLLAVARSALAPSDDGESDCAWVRALFNSGVVEIWATAEGADPVLGQLAHWWPTLRSHCANIFERSGSLALARPARSSTAAEPAWPQDDVLAWILLALLDDGDRRTLADAAQRAAGDEMACAQPWFAAIVEDAPPGHSPLAIARDLCLVHLRDIARETTAAQDDAARTHFSARRRDRDRDADVSGLPPVAQLWVEPARVAIGEAVTVSWRVRNANRVELNGTEVNAEGATSVHPVSDGEYTLRATSAAGLVRSQRLRVTVDREPPEIDCEIAPAAVVLGDPATLSWRAPGALDVTIVGVGTFGPEGSVVVHPARSVAYEFVSRNLMGARRRLTATVEVLAAMPIATTVVEVVMPGTSLGVPTLSLPAIEPAFSRQFAQLLAALDPDPGGAPRPSQLAPPDLPDIWPAPHLPRLPFGLLSFDPPPPPPWNEGRPDQ